VNVLEYCKAHKAGLLLMSTSRVYSITALVSLPLRADGDAFQLVEAASLPAGVSGQGIGVEFSTRAPISLYGSTKLAAETLTLEYGEAFGFPVWINRCGVLAGAGQFGTPDQGVFSYWIHAHARRRPLRYIGFDGTGKQTRDVFHPRDLTALADAQMNTPRLNGQRIYCAGGGRANAISLACLTAWCDARFGKHAPSADTRPRPYDLPWVVMDSSDAERDFRWRIGFPIERILEEIAQHAESHPDWLESSGLERIGP
jgi:CDP-paratose 2-epimerase